MATQRPRKPRAFKQINTGADRPILRGANSGLAMLRRLEKQYEQAQKKVAAQQRRQERRSRRLPDPNELFSENAPLTYEDVASEPPSSVMPWMNSEADPAVGPGGMVVDRPGTGPARPGEAVAPRGRLMPWLGEEEFDPFEELGVNAPTATEFYAPTRSSYPPRPRTRTMRYDRQRRILTIQFRDGGTYDYFDVPSSIWYRIRQVRSPGRFIDNNIKGVYEFERVSL